MIKKKKLLLEVNEIENSLKSKVRERWTKSEREEIKNRGEIEADFYQIWYEICKLESMRKWVKVHGYFTNSQKEILKEYRRRII